MFRLIGIQNLKKAYGSFELSVESFSLYAGEVVGVVGRNGAGKSTFLDLILGERSGDAGSVSLFGGEYAPCEMGAKRRMGFVSMTLALTSDSPYAKRGTWHPAYTIIGTRVFSLSCWKSLVWGRMLSWIHFRGEWR